MSDITAGSLATGPDATVLVKSMVDALAGPVLVVDRQLRIVTANKAAMDLSRTLRAGAPLALALRSPDILDAAQDVAAGGEPRAVSWHERVPVEQLFDVHVARFDAGPACFVVISLTDLSEARRVERMRVDFVANASHELRTPLASVLGFIETLQGPAKDDARARENFLAIMAEQARRMARLIDDLLSLSRIEQNLHVRPQGEVDLVAVVQHVCDTFAPLAHDNNVRLRIDTPQRALVTGDRDELIRVVENLIENAIKYGAAGREPEDIVEVRLALQDRNFVLQVVDHGEGIAPEHVPRLTERFYRVDAPASRTKGGTGLGLAIVKHIVARHRGRFEVTSRLGEGSCFTVRLEAVSQ